MRGSPLEIWQLGDFDPKITESPKISSGDPLVGILGVFEIFKILDENPEWGTKD